jgi:transcriptional regulator with XRE-family HTH domain
VDTFPSRLRRLRKAKGITPCQLARLTGLSKQGAYNLEADDADPKLNTIIKVAQALGVSPVALVPAKNNPLPEVNPNGHPAPKKRQ